MRPHRAALPLSLLSSPLPSPASAFSSQTHRSSPINPPRCSRGDAGLLTPKGSFSPRLLPNQHVEIPTAPGGGGGGGDTGREAPRPPARCTPTPSRCAPTPAPRPARCAPPTAEHRRGRGGRTEAAKLLAGAKAGQQRPVGRGAAGGRRGGCQALWQGRERAPLAGAGCPGEVRVAAGLPLRVLQMPGETFLPTVLCFSRSLLRSQTEVFYYFLTVNRQRISSPRLPERNPFPAILSMEESPAPPLRPAARRQPAEIRTVQRCYQESSSCQGSLDF